MNLFDLPEPLPDEELLEVLAQGKDVRIERIVSSGQASPEGFWYDQPQDEWVVLLQGCAQIGWEDGTRQELDRGDWLMIPAHKKHRVAWTSHDPPCVWLAIHGNFH